MGCPSWRAVLTGCHDVAATVRFFEKYWSAVLSLGLLLAGKIDTLLGQERSYLCSDLEPLRGRASGLGRAGTTLSMDAVQMSSASSRTRSSLSRRTMASAQLPSARSRQHPWSPWKRLPAISGSVRPGPAA